MSETNNLNNSAKENEIVAAAAAAAANVDDEKNENENEASNNNQESNQQMASTSENFKLEVKNLPKSFGFGQLRKFFNQLQLKFVKLKSPGNSSYAFVTFVDEPARAEAFRILNGKKYKGKELEAVYSKATEDPFEVALKRKNNGSEDGPQRDIKLKKEEEEDKDAGLSLEEKVQNSTTPLWNLSYEKQVEQKKSQMKALLRQYAYKMNRNDSVLFYWLTRQKQNYEGQCCELAEVVQSPVVDKYRNKCEFTIGFDKSETKTVIGFRLGEYKSGSNEVVEPFSCKNISDQMKWFVRVFQTYVDQSEYKAFNVRTRLGNWRQLTLRSNESQHLLAIIVFDMHELTQEHVEKEKSLLGAYFKRICENDSEPLPYSIVGVLFNLNTNKSGISKMDNLDVLYGQNFLNESLLDINFRISPLAFFQANTKGAEILYKKIGEICDLDENTIILDICCGTGTIGLTLAKKAKLVVGVEMVSEAIEDAKLNSSLNDIKNVEYHCGKAEDILPNLLKRFTREKVIAILDPPRAGVHSKVIQCLRRLQNLNSLIYVSCNPELAMSNFVDLARDSSKTYLYEPFVPLKAIAVDMFPHTSHCELIIFFKRYSTQLMSSS